MNPMRKEMILVPSAPANPPVDAFEKITDDAMISTSPKFASSTSSSSRAHSIIEKQPSSVSISSEKDVDCPPSPSTPRRRAIFNSFWQKSSSSLLKDDDNGEGSGREVKHSPKFEPSYLGIYCFAPSPVISPKPALSPLSSSDNLAPSPARPKSILRRHQSLRERRIAPGDRPSIVAAGRSRSASAVDADDKLRLPFAPPLCRDEASVESRSSKESDHRSYVHFDPTITVREVIGEDDHIDDLKSKWFSDNELGSFMKDAVNLCHASAVNAIKTYSLSAVAKAYAAAHEAGVKDPIESSTQPGSRALFADPVLHATDEDAIVHDGSKEFFRIMSKEVQNVLIVDNSPTTLKLFQRHVLSMFPHVRIDKAMSGKDALRQIKLNSNRTPHLYDIVITEECLQKLSEVEAEHKEDKLGDNPVGCDSLDLSGSDLLRFLNDIETSAMSKINTKEGSSSGKTLHCSARPSLKIGVSVSLWEDCYSLEKAGADLFWGKPPPLPSNTLRNQLLNTLLSKRGKSVFICGC